MKTNVAETSIEAYHSQPLNDQQREIVKALKVLGESCIADIASYLGWERSTVSGRLNDLKQQTNKLFFVGKKKSKTTGVNSEFWRLRIFQERLF